MQCKGGPFIHLPRIEMIPSYNLSQSRRAALHNEQYFRKLSSGECSTLCGAEYLSLRSNFLTAAAGARWNHGWRLVTARSPILIGH
jgi:hypothetical protein